MNKYSRYELSSKSICIWSQYHAKAEYFLFVLLFFIVSFWLEFKICIKNIKHTKLQADQRWKVSQKIVMMFVVP